MPRIAVGGFLHETNTFAPTKAAYADFVHGGGWPAMTTGADLFKVMAILPDIEAWRATLPPARRARIGCPAALLHNYRKATRPALERVTPPSQADLR